MHELYTAENAYSLTMFASAMALVTMGVIISFIKVPERVHFIKVRRIGIGLAICFFTLAIYSFFNAVTGYSHEMDYASLLVASVQAAALTGVMVLLICPDKITSRFFAIQAIFAVLLAVAAVVVNYINHSGIIALRIATGVLFCAQCWLCARLFRDAYNTALQRLEDAYDDWLRHRLRWARWGFYCGLAVGLIDYIMIGMGGLASIVYVFIYMSYYVLLTIVFIHYVSDLQFYEPIISAPPAEQQSPEADIEPEADDTETTERVRAAVDAWLARRGFCAELATADIAETMNVNIADLRKYIKTTYGEDFRTWRTHLRITEACRLFDENPEMTVKEVGELVGIPNKGNFNIYFSRFTGSTPAQYRTAQAQS